MKVDVEYFLQLIGDNNLTDQQKVDKLMPYINHKYGEPSTGEALDTHEISERIMAWRRDVLGDSIAQTEKAIRPYVKVTLNENQYAALIDLAYNCGEDLVQRSELLRLINAGAPIDQIEAQLLKTCVKSDQADEHVAFQNISETDSTFNKHDQTIDMQQIQQNKLIADYMGFKPGMIIYNGSGKSGDFTYYKTDDQLQYHTSWDWQVPVWAKLALEVKTWLVGRAEYSIQFYFKMVGKYEEAVFQNNPQRGHSIIASMLTWYNETKSNDQP